MQTLPPHLYQDYQRFYNQIPENNYNGSNTLGYDDVLKAHYLICDYFESITGVASVYGVRDMVLLGSAIGRQETVFCGVSKWKTDFEKMASLFFGLVKNHPFHDGNKRTALLCLLYHLHKNKRVPRENAKQELWEQLTIAVAASDESLYPNFAEYRLKSQNVPDAWVLFIADFLKKKTRQIDKEYKSMTYFEFESSIKRFGFYFHNPVKNFVDIMSKNPPKILGLIPRSKPYRVCQIAFPGYKRQIDAKTQKEILKKLHLTPEKGYDRQVFLNLTEPLYKIIQDYEGPLSRLRDM